MKEMLLSLLSVILLTGCTSSYVVSPAGGIDSLSYKEFNGKVGAENIRIELTTGHGREGKSLALINDSLRWVDQYSDMAVVMWAGEITRIVEIDHWLGGLEGFGLGLFAGAVAGGVVGSGTYRENTSTPRSVTTEFGAIAFGLIGGTISGIFGMLPGHTYEYQFVNRTDKMKQ